MAGKARRAFDAVRATHPGLLAEDARLFSPEDEHALRGAIVNVEPLAKRLDQRLFVQPMSADGTLTGYLGIGVTTNGNWATLGRNTIPALLLRSCPVTALEKTEAGASKKNIVELTPAQRATLLLRDVVGLSADETALDALTRIRHPVTVKSA